MGDFERGSSVAVDIKPSIASGRAMGAVELMGLQPPSSSTSDDDLQGVDERKQKRMLSNRESARRSRQRKQQYLEELREQLLELRAEHSQMMSKVSAVSQQFAQLTQENQFLRVHAMDLSQQLQHLNQNVTIQQARGFNSLDHIGFGELDMPVTSVNFVHRSQPAEQNMLPLP